MLNQKIYKRLIRGLEQQLWFFGQDTADLKNNLLMKYGFNRYRTPGHGGSSRYQVKWELRTIDLHSYCVGIYGGKQEGFLYVRAHDQAYAYLGRKAPLPGRYRKTSLISPSDKESKQRFHQASCSFLGWLEHYENWVDATYGRNYRLDCYERYHRRWLTLDQSRDWLKKYRDISRNKKILQEV